MSVKKRVQSYINGGLDKDIVDPDNGENISQKRRRFGVDTDQLVAPGSPSLDHFMFPPSTASWKRLSDGRTLLPEFSLANMLNYFVTRKVCDGKNAGDFKHMNSHSYPLFKAGHIQRIKVIKGNDNNVYFSAVCLPEMRKDREYKIQVVLSPVSEIIFAEDGCPAGKGPKGSCKHIAAFCYALEEFVRLGYTRSFLSCTSRLQTWNQPRQKKLSPKNIFEISFERAEYGKVKNKNPKPFPHDYNAIPPKHRRQQAEATAKLRELCKKMSKQCGFLKVLNTDQGRATSDQQAPMTASSQLSVFPTNCTVPSLSVLRTNFTTTTPSVPPLQCPPTTHIIKQSVSVPPISPKSPITSSPGNVTTPPPARSPVLFTPPQISNIPAINSPTPQVTPAKFVTDFAVLTPPNSLPHIPVVFTVSGSATPVANASSPENMPIKLPLVDTTVQEMPLPCNLPEEAKNFINSTVKVTLEKAFEIESSTRKQSADSEWFKLRQCRLTASNFGTILKRKKQDCSKLVERLTSIQKNLNVSSLNYGRDNEDAVANLYVDYQERHGHPGTKVFPCGLVINPKYCWLGASPDRIVYDPTSNPPYGGLEIKCIESGKGMTPRQTYLAKREPQSGKKKSFCLTKCEV